MPRANILQDHFIRDMIGEEPTWLLRKEWNAYPELRPRTEWAPVEPVQGVQYLAAMEPWISTSVSDSLRYGFTADTAQDGDSDAVR